MDDTGRIKWDVDKKKERDESDARLKALAAAQSTFNRFQRLINKAGRNKGIDVKKLLRKLETLRSAICNDFEEFGQKPPDLLMELIDEKIHVLSTNTIQFLDKEKYEFPNSAALEAHAKVTHWTTQKDFATLFLKFDEDTGAPWLCSFFNTGECHLIGQLEHIVRIKYPTYEQIQHVISKQNDEPAPPSGESN